VAINGFLRSGDGYYLRPEKYPERIDGFLLGGDGYYLRPERRGFDVAAAVIAQFAGLRYFFGSVLELALIDPADAPAGDQWRIDKNGTTYAVWLVDTSDTNASRVRVYTNDGIKAARLKT
jgi:hypothetical protein